MAEVHTVPGADRPETGLQRRAYIAATGYHHPERRVTNAELTERMETSDEWIRTHAGIVERRHAPPDVDTSDLGAIATRRALESSGLDPGDLDLLICATSTPDCLAPATASYIANKLKLRSLAFDVNAACSGFVYSMAVAEAFMNGRGLRTAAVCTAEKYSRIRDYRDQRNSILFGDSAATVILQPERPKRGLELVDLVVENLNEGPDLVKARLNGEFSMDGKAVKTIASKGFLDSASDILRRNDLDVSQIRAFAAHQANLRLIESLATELGIGADRHWHNVEMCGNQGCAGVVTSFLQGLEKNASDLKDGDLFLLTVYGAGFTGGSVLLRYIDS